MNQAPTARGTVFSASLVSIRKLWGEYGLEKVGSLLPADVRRIVLDEPVFASDWLPETHMLALLGAVWRGPAAEDETQFRRFIDGRIDVGFGRVRSLLLKTLSPVALVKRAGSLWRDDHSTGELTGTVDPVTRSCVLKLRDHPYTTTAEARLCAAEIYRYAFSLLRATSDVVEQHRVDDEGTLVVELQWGSR